jgi:hypothetical protein
MSKSVEQMQKQIELYLNQISADQKVFGTTLQILLLNMIQKGSVGPQLFHAIRDQVLGSIANTEPGRGEDQQGAERHKQLTMMRAGEFFQVLGDAAGIAPSKPTNLS